MEQKDGVSSDDEDLADSGRDHDEGSDAVAIKLDSLQLGDQVHFKLVADDSY